MRILAFDRSLTAGLATTHPLFQEALGHTRTVEFEELLGKIERGEPIAI